MQPNATKCYVFYQGGGIRLPIFEEVLKPPGLLRWGGCGRNNDYIHLLNNGKIQNINLKSTITIKAL